MTVQQKLIASLKHVLGENKEQIIGIVNLLETEEQQEKMIEYLAKNHQSKELMKISKLL